MNEKLEDFEKSLDTMLSTIKNVLNVLNQNNIRHPQNNGKYDGKGKPLSYNFKGEKPTHFYIEGKKFYSYNMERSLFRL